VGFAIRNFIRVRMACGTSAAPETAQKQVIGQRLAADVGVSCRMLPLVLSQKVQWLGNGSVCG
jgi:hypothetical protein